MERQGLSGRRSSSRRQTLGKNGPGDGWRRRPRPLDRPINLDEALAAPSQIFPSAYFVKRLPLPPLETVVLGYRRGIFVYFCRTWELTRPSRAGFVVVVEVWGVPTSWRRCFGRGFRPG